MDSPLRGCGANWNHSLMLHERESWPYRLVVRRRIARHSTRSCRNPSSLQNCKRLLNRLQCEREVFTKPWRFHVIEVQYPRMTKNRLKEQLAKRSRSIIPGQTYVQGGGPPQWLARIVVDARCMCYLSRSTKSMWRVLLVYVARSHKCTCCSGSVSNG